MGLFEADDPEPPRPLPASDQPHAPRIALAEANGIEQTLLQGMRLLTPAAGVGLLVWLGGHAVALMDAATFLAAIGLLLLIRVVEQPPASAERQHWTRELAAGLTYTARTAALRHITIAYSIAFLVFGVCVPLVLQVITPGPAPPGVMAWRADHSGGHRRGHRRGFAARVARRTGDQALMIWGLFALALLTAAFAVPVIAVVGVAMAGFGFFISWFFAGGTTTRQKHTPRELMGRVYGAVSLVMQASQAAGNALGALLILVMSYQRLAYLSAGALAVAAAYLTASQPHSKSHRPVLRRLPPGATSWRVGAGPRAGAARSR